MSRDALSHEAQSHEAQSDEAQSPVTSGELFVLSHLRWPWVWQRPQHLISRLGRGRRTIFVEEPEAADSVILEGGRRPLVRAQRRPPVERVWLEIEGPERWVGFTDPAAERYGDRLARLFPARPGRIAWLYTAAALDLARRLEPDLLVYDVMDDLTAFAGAAPEHRLRHRAALRDADVVFCGGRTLHRDVVAAGRADAHCFPSGVEPEHYARAVDLRGARTPGPPVLGYVGVVDERLDLDLIAGLADALGDWELRMIGPVAKIEPAALPERPNLTWVGPRPYERLPEEMAAFDVALMPFSLNEATRSISPTKTLEYLAAGLPVVSTRVPDVVADFGDVVRLVGGAGEAADACRRVLVEPFDAHGRVRATLHRRHWDTIAEDMGELLDEALGAGSVAMLHRSPSAGA